MSTHPACSREGALVCQALKSPSLPLKWLCGCYQEKPCSLSFRSKTTVVTDPQLILFPYVPLLLSSCVVSSPWSLLPVKPTPWSIWFLCWPKRHRSSSFRLWSTKHDAAPTTTDTCGYRWALRNWPRAWGKSGDNHLAGRWNWGE